MKQSDIDGNKLRNSATLSLKRATTFIPYNEVTVFCKSRNYVPPMYTHNVLRSRNALQQ